MSVFELHCPKTTRPACALAHSSVSNRWGWKCGCPLLVTGSSRRTNRKSRTKAGFTVLPTLDGDNWRNQGSAASKFEVQLEDRVSKGPSANVPFLILLKTFQWGLATSLRSGRFLAASSNTSLTNDQGMLFVPDNTVSVMCDSPGMDGRKCRIFRFGVHVLLERFWPPRPTSPQ
jgi:hypothetical protein